MTTPAPITPADFRAMRQRLGMTQKQLAAVLGFQTSMAVSMYETKRTAAGPLALAMRLLVENYKIEKRNAALAAHPLVTVPPD